LRFLWLSSLSQLSCRWNGPQARSRTLPAIKTVCR
jgi:hypothetical protein